MHCQVSTNFLSLLCLQVTFFADECLDMKIDYPGNDIGNVNDISSVFACQALCQETVGCVGFGLMTQWKICMRKYAFGDSKPHDGLISGPKYC